MAKKDTHAVPSRDHAAERDALKLLRRLGGLFSEMGHRYDQKTKRYIPWDTEIMRCTPPLGMDRDDNAAMVEYVASLGFSGRALSLARAIQRVYAFADDKRLLPAPSDKEGWKKMQPWVDSLRYHASVVAARCAAIHRLIRNTRPKTPLSHGGGDGKREWKPTKATQKVIKLMEQGLSNNAIAERHDVKVSTAAANLRQIRKRATEAGLLSPAKRGKRDTP